jgi:prepilin-type N-terminal cleavage/methylation domain-containing protein
MKRNERGFTLIELLLVVVIIGLMLAVIVPRAWRANVDAKYGLVRQNCSELASFAQQWAEGQILAQNESASTATVSRYLNTLAGNSAATYAAAQNWVGNNNTRTSNWTSYNGGTTSGGRIAVPGRVQSGVTGDAAPEASVEETIPPEKVIVNPFNGVNVFRSPNDPTGTNIPIPGAIACATAVEPVSISGGTINWQYYALLFQGTDSTSVDLTNNNSFYAGMGTSDIAHLRNGIFMARLGP